MSNDLFVKNVPEVIKQLVTREATDNRRSINQEVIALLEEALLRRIDGRVERPRAPLAALQDYAAGAGALAVAGSGKGH